MGIRTTGAIWLNALIGVGMCLCAFTGSLKVHLSFYEYSITFPAANIIFALMTFPATDILAEVYGRRAAQQAVWVGYASQAITILTIQLLLLLPGDTAVLAPFGGTGIRVFLASSIAYLAAQFWDVFAFETIKERITGPSHLWLRNNLSTMSSQIINSTIFISIVFGIQQVPEMLAGSIVVKCTAAIIDTPFVYLGCHLLRKDTPSLLSERSCEKEESYNSPSLCLRPSTEC